MPSRPDPGSDSRLTRTVGRECPQAECDVALRLGQADLIVVHVLHRQQDQIHLRLVQLPDI